MDACIFFQAGQRRLPSVDPFIMRLRTATLSVLTAVTALGQWEPVYQTVTHEIVVALSAPTDSICWFTTNFAHLYVTDDGGATWATVTQQPPLFLPYGLFVVDSDIAFKSSSTTVYKTTDGGVNWNSVFVGSGSLAPVVWMKDASTGVLAHDGTLYKSTDGGDTWSTNGITQPPVAIPGSSGKGTLCLHGDSIWVAQVNDGIAFSPDLGMTWSAPANNGLTFGTTPRISFGNTGLGMAVMHSNPFVFVTTDGGENWTMADNSLGANEDVLTMGGECWYIPNPADHFFIKHSADSGATWTEQLFDQNGFDVLERSRKGHTLWAGTDIGKIYRYDNGIALNTPGQAIDATMITVAPNPCDQGLWLMRAPFAAARYLILAPTGVRERSGTMHRPWIDTRTLAPGPHLIGFFDADGTPLGRARFIKR